MTNLFCVILMMSLVSCMTTPSMTGQGKARPRHWAKPVQLGGVPNLHRVNPYLYRSAQPTAEGMKNLEKIGIKKVINLRAFYDDAGELHGTERQGEPIPMKTWDVQDQDRDTFLKSASEHAKKKHPILVHCQHGADRTGAMCAFYRIRKQGWSKNEAIEEMKHGGYGNHSVWKNLIRWVGE